MPVRSPWHQEEFPRPADPWAAKVRRALGRLLEVPMQTYLPYHRGVGPGDAGFVKVWAYSYPPIVPVTYRYPGEMFISLHPQVYKPHPSGLHIEPQKIEEKSNGDRS